MIQRITILKAQLTETGRGGISGYAVHVVSDGRASYVEEITTDEMLGALARLLFVNGIDAVPGCLSPTYRYLDLPGVERVTLEAVGDRRFGKSHEWNIIQGDRHSGMLTQDECLASIASWAFRGVFLFGGLRTYAQMVAEYGWLRVRPMALLPGPMPVEAAWLLPPTVI